LRQKEGVGRKWMDDYQITKKLKELTQPAASIPLAYEKEFSLEEKEKILKDFYTSIKVLSGLIYKTRKNR